MYTIQSRRFILSSALLLTLPFSFASIAYSAKLVDLSQEKVSILQSFISPSKAAAQKNLGLEEVKRVVSPQHTLHVRLKETYMGYQVWGGDAIVHIPQGTKVSKSMVNVLSAAQNNQGSLDGTIYQEINTDLANTPSYVFSQKQADKALQKAIDNYQHKAGGLPAVTHEKTRLMVFIDHANKAHWAYLVEFYVQSPKDNMLPAKPNFIMDAVTFHVYEQWDDIKTLENTPIGGGFGGNQKMGKVVYDGLIDHLPKLNIVRDETTNTCYMKNDDVTVMHYRDNRVPTFACHETDVEHNQVYWNGEFHQVNGGYSPDNDALFGGAIIKDMYQKWYNVPVLEENGKPMMLDMIVHAPIDNAYWDGSKMTFGDGVSMFYPLTSLGVASHEISHGFTQQHSDLRYYGQSGGMNESFSDMAAQAAELYAFDKNSWQIGPEIFKEENQALRYMDKPSKDCEGRSPGDWCSIDNAKQYYSGLDVHFSSGVYNRLFYLMGTAKGWDAKKAFDVMLNANSYYWTSSTNFAQGICGVIKATKDLGYDLKVVKNAASEVGIDTSRCSGVEKA